MPLLCPYIMDLLPKRFKVGIIDICLIEFHKCYNQTTWINSTSYNQSVFIMNPTVITQINLDNLLKEAKEETLLMIENRIDISDSSIITPLEWIANQYPEIAEDCNQCLMELIKEQLTLNNEQSEVEIINEF